MAGHIYRRSRVYFAADMALNVAALVTMVVLYVVIFLVGLLGARKKRQQAREMSDASDSQLLMNGGRSFGMVVSTFTIVATWVDGGFLNGTVEVITERGLVWCQAVFGYSLSLLMGGLIIAGPVWRAGYVTMMDPLQETFGVTMASLLFLPALVGEVCWCGSILSALAEAPAAPDEAGSE
ncbi:hypothetical protein HPB49_020018 [Dermacentor silvarum]|uniref:Uncharacterized protein n=1 Tax=Dermacentor silvarum TaxID=543639 RepID=A0ACB8E2Q3_DERSI|nr:hypothetical protein HPB49_020018 [Dermacentor silvarum]